MTLPKWAVSCGKPYPVFHIDARPGPVRRFFAWLLLGWRWRRLS